MNMVNLKSKLWAAPLALLLGALACSAPGGAVAPTPTALGTAEAVATAAPSDTTLPPTATDAAAPTTAPASASGPQACPAVTDGTALYLSQDNGVCFLYPSDTKAADINQPDQRGASVTGQPLDPNSPEPMSAHLEVYYNGPADVATSADYAAKWKTAFNLPSSAPTEMIIAGQSAMVVPDAPAMATQRMAFIVVNGQKYTITTITTGLIPQLQPQLDKIWDTVTGSIVFFTPASVPNIILAENVCPKAGGDNMALIDWGGGVCMLYPQPFAPNQEFAAGRGWLDAEPVLGQGVGGPVRANLTIAYASPAQGQTPRQLFQARLVNKAVSKIDDAGAQDTTLSGQPAIVWTEGAPVGSRQAIIVAHDRVYTIINQPYNDPNFPGGEANVDLVWKVVTENLAFFDPWK